MSRSSENILTSSPVLDGAKLKGSKFLGGLLKLKRSRSEGAIAKLSLKAAAAWKLVAMGVVLISVWYRWCYVVPKLLWGVVVAMDLDVVLGMDLRCGTGVWL